YGLKVMPHWKESRVLRRGARRTIEKDGRVLEYLNAAQHPGEDVFSQIDFALRREGLHLELLRKLLPMLELSDVTEYVRSKPTGRYSRVIWWLYESFAKQELPIPDVVQGNYVNLLDSDLYVVGPVRKVRRQRINVNLLGTVAFSPMVRTVAVQMHNEDELRVRCQEIVREYPPEIFQRAVRFLYAKESRSSHEIERETPEHRRAEVFIGLLEQAWHRSFLKKEALVEIHRAIVDSRYADPGWRSDRVDDDRQVYVGETLVSGLERIHYAAPKPDDLDELMSGFLAMAKQITTRRVRMGEKEMVIPSSVPTLVAATVVSFAFDFLHPFSDGNGRIHRFLLHHVLARNGFGPDGIVLPVSAVILHRPHTYDQALESFSRPLMRQVEYTMDERQRMTVMDETVDFYRYIDCTEAVRIGIEFIRVTVEEELPAELGYLAAYDEIRSRMREIVDLPDRIADLFIKLCRQNGGQLSARKRAVEEFKRLTDEEIAALESILKDVLKNLEV
ncbi:MAG: Fic family protein, partial [Chthoniobacterales bacterium]